jgi:CBS domain-containing protein
MKEFVDFLGGQPPYDALDTVELERLVGRLEVEYVTAGTVIVPAGAEPLDHLYVIRTGAVEILDRGRVVDLLGPGDTFGQVSVLSGLPPELSGRAAEDTLCYRLPDPRTVLDHPERLRFDRGGRQRLGERLTGGGPVGKDRRPVSDFLRPVVWCEGSEPVRAVAVRVSEAGQSCALVRLPAGVGIVTDQDFRRRVAAGLVPVDAPVAELATVPVISVSADTAVATAYLHMVERGVHHLVVVDSARRPTGVVRVVDMASAEVRDPLLIRAAIDAAQDLGQLADACQLLRPSSVELWDAGVAPIQIGALLGTIVDAVLRRLIELGEYGAPGGIPCGWLVLGSIARREPLPDSDVDTAVVWASGGAVPADAAADAVRAAAGRLLDDMERCGLRRCPNGANATNPLFSRSAAAWAAAAADWTAQPGHEGAALLASMLADSRPLTDLALGRSALERMLAGRRTGAFLRILLAHTVAAKPPTGFVRGLVVEHTGEHRGMLDLKRGGLAPVVALGRWLALVTGDVRGPTPDRLRRAGEAGLLPVTEAETLVGAFTEAYALLLDRAVAAIRSGAPVTSWVAPADLDLLTRRFLRETFRAVARVQSRLEMEWMGRLS